jgi:uncharacterized protein (TIGR03435 family)
MRRCILLFLLSGCSLLDARPRDVGFEVASIREAAPGKSSMLGVPIGAVRGGPGSDSPYRILYNGATVFQLITMAYGMRSERVVVPDWLKPSDAKRYDINATAPPDVSASRAVWRAGVGAGGYP